MPSQNKRRRQRQQFSYVGHRFLRRQDVERITGLSRSSIYEKMAAGTFPKQVKLAQQTVGWIEAEVVAWMAARIAERNDGTALKPYPRGTRAKLIECNDADVIGKGASR
jgi:prophage regulatory protein